VSTLLTLERRAVETVVFTPARAHFRDGDVEVTGPTTCDRCSCSLTESMDYEDSDARVSGADYRTKTWFSHRLGTEILCDGCADAHEATEDEPSDLRKLLAWRAEVPGRAFAVSDAGVDLSGPGIGSVRLLLEDGRLPRDIAAFVRRVAEGKAA
jgi:hypothetical protein